MKAIALYLRVSVEDKKKGESESISNQRELLKHYIAENPEFSSYRVLEFIDDGCSGTNFERPQLKKMIEMAGNDIKVIIVKDFSRFGRSLLDVGNYLDIVFPFLGVRFIAVNEHFDSDSNKGSTTSLEVGLKSLIYEMYSKDLSRKSTASRAMMCQKGLYVFNIPPFGFLKSSTEKHKLIPNPETAPIVKRIYELRLNGMSVSNIAKTFNAEKIPTPLAFRKKYQQRCDLWAKTVSDKHWEPSTIRAILKDERYTGRMVGRKTVRVAVGSCERRKAHEHEIIYCDNAHEPIVSKTDWNKIQQLFTPSQQSNVRKGEKSPLLGLLKCGHCLHNLDYTKKVKVPYFICHTSYKVEDCSCKGNRITESEILDELLREIRSRNFENDDKSKSENKNEATHKILEKRKEQIQLQLKQLDFKKSVLFEKLADEKVSVATFSKESEKLNHERLNLEKEQEELFLKLGTCQLEVAVTTDLPSELRSMISHVLVYHDKNHEIVWK